MDLKGNSDLDLVLAALLGDLRAFDLLAMRYRSALLIVANPIVGFSEAEDVVQESLIRAFNALPTLAEPTKFSAWLHAITRNCALQHHKRQQKSRSILEQVVLSEYLALDPAVVLERMDANTVLTEAIQDLKPEYQTVVQLCYWAEMSQAKIAEFLGVSLTTVKWRLRQAKLQLRQTLIQKGEIDE